MTEKYYENLVIKNDKFTQDTQLALGIVKKYIIENKLIVVGGMSIDYALRLKGSKLYDDDSLPDYDFYSYQYNFDAYQIAERLHSIGLNHVSVINANHTSTMRVRVNYTVVADVTYVPKNIFDSLPFIMYRGIKIIHPHYQIIDQHRSLSMPYENTPWEVITHRWEKDTIRYDVLYGFYPIEYPDVISIEHTDKIIIPYNIFENQCISGFAGLLYWHDLATQYGFKEKTNLGTIEINPGYMTYTIPKDSHGISIYSDNIEKLKSAILTEMSFNKIRMYNKFLDKMPNKIIIDNTFELFDNKGYMISAHKIDNNIHIANLQTIMVYMLSNFIILQKIKNINRGDTFKIGYLLAKDIVNWAVKLYCKTPLDKFKPFLPSPHIFGDIECSDSYLNSKRLFLEKIGDLKKSKLQPDMIFPETFINGKIPQKHYKFKPENSLILKFDGLETKKLFDRFSIIK